jgi:hypothetical protein
MSWFRVYEIDILRVGQLYLQQGIDSLYPAPGTVLTSDGSGGTFWTPVGGSQAALTSTILGLGNLGYLSTQQLQSTVNGLGNIYLSTGGGGTGDITTAALTSTVRGLGTIGYISSLSSFQSRSATISSLTTSNITASTGYISSLAVDSITFGDGTGWIDLGVLRAQAVSTIQINSYIANLTQVNASSLQGDGSKITNLNAISSGSLISTVVGLGNIYLSTGGGGTGEVTTAQLTSTTRGLGTAGYLSTPSLSSFSTAIGTVFYSQSTGVSSLNAPSLTSLQGSVSSITTNAIQVGTGTGWILLGPLQTIAASTIILNAQQATVSSIQGDGSLLQNVAGVSSAALFTSNTSNWSRNLLQNWSTSLSTTALFTSNTSNYFQNTLQNWSTSLSTVGLFTSNTSNYFQNTFQNWSTPLSTVALFTSNSSNWSKNILQDWSTQQNTIYQFTSNTSNYFQNTLQNWSTPLYSTTAGLGSATYISSTQLTSTVRGFYTTFNSLSVGVSTLVASNFTATTATISSLIVNSLQFGDGTGWVDFGPIRAVALSTIQINADSIYANQVSSSTFLGDGSQLTNLNAISSASLQSTVRGLGFLYLSTISQATLFTSNTSNFARNILQDWSTAVSTVALFASNAQGVGGGAGVSSLYGVVSSGLSTVALFTSNSIVSTVIGLGNIYVSSGLTQTSLTSTVIGLGNIYVSSGLTQTSLTSTVIGLGNIYVSSGLTQTSLTSTAIGLGTLGYISTGQFLSSQVGLYSNISSMIDPVELASTIIGLGSAGFVSSIGLTAILNSTVSGINSNVSSMIDPTELASTVVGIATTGYISSTQLDKYLASTTTGLGTAGYASTSYVLQTSNYFQNLLQNWSTPLSTTALFTSNTSNWSRNLLQDFSTPLSTVALFTSNTSNFFLSNASGGQVLSSLLGIVSTGLSTTALFTSNTSNWSRNLLQDFSTGLSTTALFTSNTSNWSRNLLQNWSTPDSTIALFTSNTSNYFQNTLQNWSTPLYSTMNGLGTASYISSAQLVSTVQSIFTNYRSLSVAISSLTTSNLTALTGYISSLQVDSLQFGDGTGWADFGALRAVVISTIQINADSIYANQVSSSTFLGDGSQLRNLPAISSLSLQSTVRGLGTAGYLSTISQATLFTSNTSNYFQNTLQNWSTGLSTVALFTSNTSNYFQNTLQNWSTSLSTVALFTSNTSNWSRNLLQDWSTQQNTIYQFTSNTSNYYSNLQQNWSTPLSTAALFTSNTSNYFQNTLQNWSTPLSTVALFTSNTSNFFLTNAGGAGTSSLLGVVSTGFSTLGLFTSNTSNWSRNLLQDFSTPLSTVALFTSNTSNWSRNLLQDFSTPLSTVALFTSNSVTSTTLGLARIYLSSFSTFSLSTGTMTISTLGFMDINNNQRQSLYVSSGVLVLNGQGIAGGSGNTGFTISDYVVSGKLNSDQSIVSGDPNKIIQFSDDFDPQNWYDATNYRFTPTIAGYYYVSYAAWFAATPSGGTIAQVNIQIDKNSGTNIAISQAVASATDGFGLEITKIVYMNGSTDNLRFNAYVGSTSNGTVKAYPGTWFSAALLTNGSSGDNLISTVLGLGTAGYVSTIALTQTSNYFQNTLQNWSTPLSTTALFTSNTSNYFQNTLQNWSTSLSTTALFTSNTSNWSRNLLQDFSTPISTVALFTSNSLASAGGSGVSSLFGLLSTGLSTVARFTSNTSNYFLPLLSNDYSTNLISTVVGLGSARYVSTSLMGAHFSSLSSSYAVQFITSGITTSSIFFGTGSGFLVMPNIRPTTISTQFIQTSTIIAIDPLIGIRSSFTAIKFFGLEGNYTNTAIAEISTGAGRQELLFFKGSSINDRIRFTTTGDIRFEPQVSAQLFSNNPALAVPTMILQSNLVGIGTNAPARLLDVAGEGRFQTVSTQALFLSSISGQSATELVFASSLISTVRGLGTIGYVSSFNNIPLISAQSIFVSSIGIGCNAPRFQLDIVGTSRSLIVSSAATITSSFSGNLNDAQTVVLFEI